VRRDLVGDGVEETPMHGPRVRRLLGGLDDDTVRHPYKKWEGAHWRLVELDEWVRASQEGNAVARRRLELRPARDRPPLLLPRVAYPDARPLRVRRHPRLFRRTDTGEPIHPEWIRLHHPPLWHYDIVHALTVLARMDRAGEPRAATR
jgi:hypothetical protein